MFTLHNISLTSGGIISSSPVEHSQEITVLLSSQPIRWQIGAHDYVPDDSSPNIDAEVDLIPSFMDSARIIPRPHAAAQLAEALYYKLEDRSFNS
jgi:hypothetical protein